MVLSRALWQLNRYLFFASVVSIQRFVKDLLVERAKKPSAKQEKFLLLDLCHVDGVDVTGKL